MTTMSFVFFGLMLIPLVVFMAWLIRKDKKKNYLGIVVLALMAIVALVVIVRFDSKFLKNHPYLQNNKAHTPSYR
ncbi:hypothetical protein [Pedobacter frigoris]|uniref:Uncharacterized protein n=1 Tax=Pedobacter frigoris TaxID=2571272 RepID=A0A4U1CCD5_9SPHI|nr:hypothetical protein [Pedobacter frigoris]TKC03756.1 hypothetical protein FA047_19545 [Pedobacter frigoris]